MTKRPLASRVMSKSLAYLLLLALSFTILLPLGWMVTVALKPDFAPVFTTPTQWFPTSDWHWENFGRALSDPARPFLRYTLNTLVIVGLNIVGTVISCSLVGYAFARLKFPGREFLFGVLIVTLLIPWHVLLIPQFLMYFKLGWYGSILPLVVPAFFGNAFFIFLIRQYIRTLPREFELAATVDGCNRLQVFWHIILPLCRPVLAVCVVFAFLTSWNDLLGPLIYLLRNEDYTVAIGMANMVSRANPKLNLLMAANLIMMVPPIVLYFVAQEKLIGGIASVGIKG
ncbi:carbohydrate ABC transporter permease [Micromonospora sp. NPDC049645]|uniref:carbohydrate ABC transporter permease n=1 Tax=Micromonospora sp. NPDC049645 TaxID=3155508 RepID=UPI0034411C1F